MPKKRKPVSEMSPRELLRRVFPERLVKRIEKEFVEPELPDQENEAKDD